MSTEDPTNPRDELDRATAQRLAKLRSMPVDTTNLDRAIAARIPRPPQSRPFVLRIHPLRAVAAAIGFLAITAVVMWSLSGGQALASPDEMAKFHQDLLSGRIPAVTVESIDQANQTLSAQWSGMVQLPRVPTEHSMICCMRQIKDKRVACVLLRSEGVPVTMAVAHASDMRLPRSGTVAYGGLRFHVQSSGQINMVSTQWRGRWICLIGQLPAERLMNIAAGMQF